MHETLLYATVHSLVYSPILTGILFGAGLTLTGLLAYVGMQADKIAREAAKPVFLGMTKKEYRDGLFYR